MCYIIKKKKAKRKTHKPTKKSRTKTRKLSLISLELSSAEIQQSTTNMPSSAVATATSSSTNHHQQQLNLFPLHPENTDENNMAYLFSSVTDGGAASTLTGLLGTSTTMTSRSEEQDASAASLSYAAEVKEIALLRTALRNKERDSSEERYVRYSEVVERRDEEVTSSAVDLKCGNRNLTVKIEKKEVEKQRLSLKLDYEEILNAWSDKGSLYIYADSPQIVPDIHDNFLASGLSNGLSDHHIWGSHAGLWTVPELSRCNPNIHEIKKEEEQQEQHAGVGLEEWKLGKRKASVLRYKEKRQNRLFSKQIRYQVRKQNAEKRPRVKGRFVKRS